MRERGEVSKATDRQSLQVLVEALSWKKGHVVLGFLKLPKLHINCLEY